MGVRAQGINPQIAKTARPLQALLGLYMEGDPCTSTFDADVAKYKHMGKICHKLESQVPPVQQSL